MGIICFGSYAKYLKDATPLTNDGIISLLFDAIAPSSGYSLDAADKSKLLNSKRELPIFVKDSAGTIAVANSIERYFCDRVIPQIKSASVNLLISLLVGLVNGDGTIPATDKTNFLSKASTAQLPAFLSSVYLYAVQQPNNLKTNPLPAPVTSNSVITIASGRLYLDGIEVKMPDKLTPPETHASDEAVYIAELLRAYAEAENVPSIASDAIPNKYKRNFDEQRQSYMDAEAVRRRVREVFPPDRDEFEVFKDDTYHGVSAVHAQNWSHGYERLLNVLKQAVLVPRGRSLLETQLSWIGSSHKMGVCHILVNDGLITWVVPNE